MKFDYNSYGRNPYAENPLTEYWFVWLPIVLSIAFCVGTYMFADMFWVTDDRATAYILDITEAESVEILNDDGNENPILHELSDVTFDVRLTYSDGSSERQQFRCTDGFFRNLICRGYND